MDAGKKTRLARICEGQARMGRKARYSDAKTVALTHDRLCRAEGSGAAYLLTTT
jgi:hypothetical protein